jgi:ATP-binding cassette subfamily B protein
MFRDLGPYIGRYGWRFGIGTMLGMFVPVAMGAVPFFLRQTIDAVQAGRGYVGFIGLILLTSLVANVLSWSSRRLAIVSTRYMEHDLRMDLFGHTLWLDSYFYARHRIGDLVNRYNSDLGAVREMLSQGFIMGIRLLFFVLVAYAAMYMVNWKLAAILSLVAPTIFVIMVIVLRLIDQRYRESQEVFDQISVRAQENFSGMRVVKGFALEGRELEAFQDLNRQYIAKSLALVRVEGPLRAIMGFLMGIGILLVMGVGGGMTVRGELTVGQLVQFNAYLMMLGWPIMGLGWTLSLFQRGVTSWGRLKEILDTKPRIQDAPQPVKSPGLSGEVRFENVTLELGDRKVLDGITLTIPEGITLGITGRTGSGKTMLVNLIPRLLDPTQGKVYVGGHEVKSLALADLRLAIGMVPQEPFLFSDTLAENISFGLPEADPARAEAMARLAGVHEDIAGFPQGYQTSLGERGVTLSGGQRQRTALARALARRPKILILDDSMSAVDTETESRILSGLKSLLGQQTTLLIAHRTSTLRYADWIVVLDQGKIVEEGTHEMLLEQGGIYAELERIQRLQDDVEEEVN